MFFVDDRLFNVCVVDVELKLFFNLDFKENDVECYDSFNIML